MVPQYGEDLETDVLGETSDKRFAHMFSERLRYEPVEPTNLYAFHGLVQDEHVRRYMMEANA